MHIYTYLSTKDLSNSKDGKIDDRLIITIKSFINIVKIFVVKLCKKTKTIIPYLFYVHRAKTTSNTNRKLGHLQCYILAYS